MRFNLNFQIALYGLIILLLGLIFLAFDVNKYSIFVIPLTNIGASILATGLTSWLITRALANVDVAAVVQALAEHTKFTRSDHKLELIFTLKSDGTVRVSGEHEFTLTNTRNRRARKTFSIYTDLGSWNKAGGFESILEPNNKLLKGKELQSQISYDDGKAIFNGTYSIDANSKAKFKFNTYGNYRRIDRLVWTVQDLSTDFHVRIVNRTGVKNAFLVKVNHHREKSIIECKQDIQRLQDNAELIELDFNSEVLPYQGFEVLWDLDHPKSKITKTPLK